MTVHKNLTGADLHEPKGADTAASGEVYVADGAGSGSWTAASSIITNSAWSTGDVKWTMKTTADTGWILGQAGTIGDGSSGAAIRANADTSDLFTLLWTNFSNTLCPVSGGRGASAAADFAAHKTITLPDMWQRAVGVAGSYGGAGQTSRALGAIVGTETQTLITANLPAYTPSGTVNTGSVAVYNGIDGVSGPGGASVVKGGTISGSSGTQSTSLTQFSGFSFTGSAQGGTSTPFSIMNPTVYINIMIKL
jgi:microcystin-dependent protein